MSTPAGSVTKSNPFRWLTTLVSSSIGAKYLVAITGLLLTGFVLFHMLGNLQVFLGRDAFNSYAQKLKSTGPLLWVARGGLLTLLVTHLFLALRLKKISLDARPVRYVYENTVQATIASRYMVLTGLVIFAFVTFHLAHFTLGWIDRTVDKETGRVTNYLDLKDEAYKDPADPKKSRHDAYGMFVDGFRNVPVALLYIVCNLLLGMHLLHGVRSVFQTLGLNHVKYNTLLSLLGYGTTAAIVAGNCTMPLAVMLGLLPH